MSICLDEQAAIIFPM